MKRLRIRLACALAILVSVIASVGCGDAGGSDGASAAVLVLGFDSSAKTLSRAKSLAIVPDGLSISSIEVKLSGPDGSSIERSSDGSAIELELAPGTWTIRATGYNGDGIPLVEGSSEVRLEPSERTSHTVALRPISGKGSIALGWSLRGELDGGLSVSGSLEGPGGETRSIESPFDRSELSPLVFEDLPCGGWKLSLSLLRDGVAVCGLAEGVLVAAGMRTAVTVDFDPPAANLAITFIMPDYSSTSLALKPAVRRAASGQAVALEADCAGDVAWYAEGSRLAETGSRLLYTTEGSASSVRIDCVLADDEGSAPPRSGSARIIFREAQALDALEWSEILRRSEQDEASQAASLGLSDCRDLCWSPSGGLLAAAGRDSGSVSLFDAAAAGALFPIASIDASDAPDLVAPSRLRFVAEGRLLALSESEGAVYAISIEGPADAPTLRLAGVFADASLSGAKDLALAPAGTDGQAAAVYVAAQATDSVVLLALGEEGLPASARIVAGTGAGELASFSRPSCVALDGTGTLLAVGTSGDDALYLFGRDAATGDLAFRQRINKSSFPASAPLSDPISLAFSPDSASLFVLSYYGKSIARLDRDASSGAFAPQAGSRSGTGGVRGFATPRALGLNPKAGLAAVAGSGAEDGLAAFDIEASSGGLAYLGAILPTEGDAVPPRPMTLAFSPDGSRLALAADGSLSIFTVLIEN